MINKKDFYNPNNPISGKLNQINLILIQYKAYPLGLLNLKYNKLKQNRPNEDDWGDNKKILIDINEIWVSDISETDNEKCDGSEMDNRMVNASEMDDKWFNAIRGCWEVHKSSYNTLTWSKGHWFWVITLLTSQISFSYLFNSVINPSKLLYIIKLVDLLKIPIII